jgi:hypothetical protein
VARGIVLESSLARAVEIRWGTFLLEIGLEDGRRQWLRSKFLGALVLELGLVGRGLEVCQDFGLGVLLGLELLQG